MQIPRRSLLAAASVAGPTTLLAGAALAQRAGSNSCVATGFPSRMSGPIEIAYKAPHGQPNGLTQGPNPGELWVQDRGVGSQITLIRASDGKVIREIITDAIGPSGITVDDDGVMWTSDTHGAMLVSFNAANGAPIAKYFTPGACRLYEKRGDAPRRGSPLKLAYPGESRAMGDAIKHNEGNDTGSDLGPGRMPLDTKYAFTITGAAGLVAKGDLLIYSCLPARAIFSVDKKSWLVQEVWATPGSRTLGLCWADKTKSSFWCAEANLNTLYRYDAASGAILESIVLPENSPVLHGCQVVENHMYFTDDMGWICRFRM